MCSEFDSLSGQAQRYQTHQPKISFFFFYSSYPTEPEGLCHHLLIVEKGNIPFSFSGNNNIHWPEEKCESTKIGLATLAAEVSSGAI